VNALLGVSRDAKGAAERTADLYARHGQRIYSFCRSRLRSQEEAQDAAQTAFLYALGSLQRGVVPRNELAWLLTIADNVCRSSRRTLGRRLSHVANADVDELEPAAPSLNAETREEIAQLRAALEQLPDRQRQAILLREWQGLSYADIAEQLGLSLAAVETLLFRSACGARGRGSACSTSHLGRLFCARCSAAPRARQPSALRRSRSWPRRSSRTSS